MVYPLLCRRPPDGDTAIGRKPGTTGNHDGQSARSHISQYIERILCYNVARTFYI